MPRFGKNTITLIQYTLVVGGSFYLGAFLYTYISFDEKVINTVSIKKFQPALDKASGMNITLNAGNTSEVLKSDDIKKMIEPYVRNYTGEKDEKISYSALEDYVESIAANFDIQPVNAKLRFQDNRADIFTPSISGKRLNIGGSVATIAYALVNNTASVSLPYDTIEPDVTLEKINDLGIKTLLGRGESDYGRSSVSRITNIKIGLGKFNGIILASGEEFSFNKFLGDVDETGGYQSELVIKSGLLVKEFGGGLCQVATTVFRSAIMAGLPITERKPHSFPVHYYNPQGYDATIYPGVVDLKFLNNTSGHILIQAKLVGSRLVVEIYGSEDGRKVVLDGPYQYDAKPNGALKAYFNRIISYSDGTQKKERFDSSYNPPPASPLEKNPLE